MNLAPLTEPTILYTTTQELVLVFVKPLHHDSDILEEYLYTVQSSLLEDEMEDYVKHMFRIVDMDVFVDICDHYAIDEHDAPHVVVLDDGVEQRRTATLEHCTMMLDDIIDKDVLEHMS